MTHIDDFRAMLESAFCKDTQGFLEVLVGHLPRPRSGAFFFCQKTRKPSELHKPFGLKIIDGIEVLG